MRYTKTKAVLAGLALAFTAACGSDDKGGGSDVADNPSFKAGTTMAKLSDAGKMTIGTKFDQPGFGLLGLEDKPEGFDVEVAKIIAGALGIDEGDITWKESTSDVREQLIEDGEVDLVAATYTINDERKQRITFAGPYYVAGQQLMVKSDNDAINGPDDLKDASVRVCSVTGSTPSEQIKPYLADVKKQLTLFDVYDKCAKALENDQTDVVTTDNVILLGFAAESDGDFKLVGDQFTEEPYGLGITKGDVEFCEFINDTLQKNEDAYNKAWEGTAGKIKGTQAPTLPEPAPCS
jgi:glutamate transport system substrate-binding protein